LFGIQCWLRHAIIPILLLSIQCHTVVNFKYDCTLLSGVPVHYCFQTSNLNCELSIQCQFCWWIIYYFFRDLGKFQKCCQFRMSFYSGTWCTRRPLLLSDLNLNCELSIQCQFSVNNKDLINSHRLKNFKCLHFSELLFLLLM